MLMNCTWQVGDTVEAEANSKRPVVGEICELFQEPNDEGRVGKYTIMQDEEGILVANI